MKIGILTQPLHNNYGGLLQCYALQSVLKSLGHDVWIVQRETEEKKLTIIGCTLYYIKQIVKVFLGRKFVGLSNRNKIAYAERNTKYFASNFINPKTEIITTTNSLRLCHSDYGFDAYVVGSDQVWRPSYSPCIGNYFFDFLYSEERVRRVAYAASFGVDNWEFSKEETAICRDLLKYFDGVSVREDSAVTLCAEYLGREDVLHVLDPTMLLDKEDYISLVEKEEEPQNSGNLFCYLLDESEEKSQIIDFIATQINAVPFTKMPKCSIIYENLRDRLEDCVYPTVTAWLRAFMDADMVITDSFHGCVFSIIFNKPFWVIGNRRRGLARFNSLLSIFELQDRLIDTYNIPSIITSPINWEKVNIIRGKWQEKSLNFLKKTL